MEVKKSQKANVQKASMLYFLIGLNVVLLTVLLMFNYRYYEAPPEVEVEPEEIVAATEAVIIDIPQPETPPPPPPPDNEPPPPPPPIVPKDIEMSPDPVEPPPIKDQNTPTPPEIPTGPPSTGPVKNINLDDLRGKVNKNKGEERELAPVTVNRVAEMAVYPGCEKYKGDKRKLVKCFSDELGNDILKYLDVEFPDVNKEVVGVRLEFHVNTDGYITDINPKHGDDAFKPQAKRALEKAAEYLRRKGQIIEPAKMSDGSKAVLIFTQPVKLQNPNY